MTKKKKKKKKKKKNAETKYRRDTLQIKEKI